MCPTQQSRYYRDGRLLKLWNICKVLTTRASWKSRSSLSCSLTQLTLLQRTGSYCWHRYWCIICEKQHSSVNSHGREPSQRAALDGHSYWGMLGLLSTLLILKIQHHRLVSLPLLANFLGKNPFLSMICLRTKLPNAHTACLWAPLIYCLPQQGHFLVDSVLQLYQNGNIFYFT